MALSYAGRQAEARAEFETALAILGTAVGDQHPPSRRPRTSSASLACTSATTRAPNVP
ncbi:MAG: hypothetical protein IPK74_36580 [Deltaproteobacteria bacterium]|nr:hypothetical protein [Deltaproteobacteria bacterium]